MKKIYSLLLSLLAGGVSFGQGSEDFTNIPTVNSGGYTARTWVGTDNVTWTGDGATGQTMTGPAFTIKDAGFIKSPVYANGMGTLTFDYVRAFTGTGVRSFTVWVNNTQIGSPVSVNASSNTVVQYSQAINVSGNVQLEIRATSGTNQIKIDNISWTAATCSGAPTAQAGFGTITPNLNSATVAVSAGTGGSGRVVKMNTVNSFTSMTDGANPTANLAYTSGEQVIYNGTGTSVGTVTGLSSSTTYYLAVYEYNCATGRYYLNPAATTQFTTLTPCIGVPTAQAGFGTITPALNAVTVSVTPGTGGGGRVVKINTTNLFTNMVDGSNPTAALAYGGSGEQVVYNGTGTNAGTITGLTSSTTYYLAVYEYNCATDRYYLNPANVTSFTTLIPPPEGLQLLAENTGYTIDFDNTVSGVNNGSFSGGANTSPATGNLNSNSWYFSTNTIPAAIPTFGSSYTSMSQANPGVTTASGNNFSMNIAPGNQALAVQPTGSNYTPGSIILKVQNKTGVPLTKLSLGFNLYVYNDAGQSASVKVGYASGSTFTDVTTLTEITPVAADASPALTKHFKSVDIDLSAAPVAANNYAYIRWSFDDAAGSGSRDELAIDDIQIIANATTNALQMPSGTVSSAIYNANVTLTAATLVTDKANFVSGIVTTGTSSILTIDNAATITGGSSTAYVDGPIAKNVNTTAAFTLPVGRGGAYRPVTIVPNSTAATAFSVEYFNTAYSNTNVTSPLVSVSNNEYWNIDRTGTANADITLTWGSASNVANTTDVKMAHFNSGANAWESLGGTTSGTATAGSVTVTGVSSFSPFTIGSSSTPLPVQLVSFTGEQKNGQNILSWTTAMEHNNRGFEVLYAADGINYQSAGFVNTLAQSGNSNEKLVYSFTQAANGAKAYYKLNQVDVDGARTTSGVVVINNAKQAGTFGLYPNPVKANLVQVSFAAAVNTLIIVTDATGKEVMQQKVENASQAILEVGALPAGTYLIRANGTDFAGKFVKL